jgi:signal transduction histidine kinase
VREFPFASDLRTLMTLPLMAQSQKLGLLVVGKQVLAAPLSYGDLELLSVLSAPAAVAIKNAQLFEEIQNAYKKVEESDFLKSEFIAIASHELRTPLVSVLGYVEMLTYEAKGEMLDQLNIVLEQALRLRDIVNDMLSLTDLRAGITEIIWDVASTREILNKAFDSLRVQMAAKQVQVMADIAPNCQELRGDSERLVLVFSKLLSNAVKFSPIGEQVRISAHRDEAAVVFAVADRGAGITPEAQKRLFQPFYQEEESLRRTHSGMGLGLSIAKGMIELHGGSIWVESEVGKGSTFFFSIPQLTEG